MATALRILLSEKANASFGVCIAQALAPHGAQLVKAESAAGDTRADFDIAFLTRDVTGLSTKFVVAPATQPFYDLLRNARSLKWVQMHSAGADRPIFGELAARGVTITSGSGANAPIVAQSAIAGLLAIARHFPELMAAQKARTWAPHCAGQSDGNNQRIAGIFLDNLPRWIAGENLENVVLGPGKRA